VEREPGTSFLKRISLNTEDRSSQVATEIGNLVGVFAAINPNRGLVPGVKEQ